MGNQRVDLFLHATDQVFHDNSGGVMIIGTHMLASETKAAQRAHVVEQIVDRHFLQGRAA